MNIFHYKVSEDNAESFITGNPINNTPGRPPVSLGGEFFLIYKAIEWHISVIKKRYDNLRGRRCLSSGRTSDRKD